MKSTTPISKIKNEFSLKMQPASADSKSSWHTLKKSSLPMLYRCLPGGKPATPLFPVYRILLYLIVGWMLGCERLFHFRKLQHDSLIKPFSRRTLSASFLAVQRIGAFSQSCPNLRLDLRTLNQESFGPAYPAT